MENAKQVGGGGGSSSASSFTTDLFGPKDSSSSSSPASSGVFGSVFGPSSTGLGKDSSSYYSGYGYGSDRKQDFGSQYGKNGSGNGKYGTSDLYQSKSGGENGGKDESSMGIYQSTETAAEPCYFSSSIYYGGQQVYSPPTSHNTTANAHHAFKKDGRDEDPNGSNNLNSASRGNWWQGSLYY